MNKHYESIQTWGSVADMMATLADNLKSGERHVELGVWKGASLCCLGAILEEQGKRCELIAVDLWAGDNVQEDLKMQNLTGEAVYNQFLGNIASQGITDQVIIHREETVPAAKHYKNFTIKTIFIDADHSYDGVLADMRAWWPKLKRGGIMSGHDWLNTNVEVQRAVNDFAKEKGLKVEISKDQWPSWYVRNR